MLPKTLSVGKAVSTVIIPKNVHTKTKRNMYLFNYSFNTTLKKKTLWQKVLNYQKNTKTTF